MIGARMRATLGLLAGGAILTGCAPLVEPAGAQGAHDLTTCTRAVERMVSDLKARHVPDNEILRAARISEITCLHPEIGPERARFVGSLNDDLASLDKRFLGGKMTAAEYLRAAHESTAQLTALGHTNSTPAYVPYDQRPKGPPIPALDRASVSWERNGRAIQNVKIMINPACDGAPPPPQSRPIAWGRGFHAPGYNIATTKVATTNPNCELFYQFSFLFRKQGDTKFSGTVVTFKASENKSTGKLAVFNLPATGAIPPSRAVLRGALSNALTERWRVRVVNGNQDMSAWSDTREQGPASSGVDI
jgi:hypothetical protein